MMAPVIPALTDSEIENVLEAAAEHGATEVAYILLRLPWKCRNSFGTGCCESVRTVTAM